MQTQPLQPLSSTGVASACGSAFTCCARMDSINSAALHEELKRSAVLARVAGHVFAFPAANGSSSGADCGSWQLPCQTIRQAIRQAAHESSILVGPGVLLHPESPLPALPLLRPLTKATSAAGSIIQRMTAPATLLGLLLSHAKSSRLCLPAGVYTGTGNHDLSFGGADLQLDSLAGAQHTTINCQGRGRAFVVAATQTPDTLIAGPPVLCLR